MRALISGGSSGIGASACLRIAEAALARGVQPMIAVCGHKPNTSQEEVVRSIQSMGGTAIALVGDLGDADVPGQLVEAAATEFGGLDALVANAGVASPGAICDLSVKDWDDMFSVNLRGAWLLAKASYAHLKRSRGAACFTSSMSGQLPGRTTTNSFAENECGQDPRFRRDRSAQVFRRALLQLGLGLAGEAKSQRRG